MIQVEPTYISVRTLKKNEKYEMNETSRMRQSEKLGALILNKIKI